MPELPSREWVEWLLDSQEPFLTTMERQMAQAYLDLLDRVEKVEALFAGGPETSCRTTWRAEGLAIAPVNVECVEVPMADLRAALGGDHEQPNREANQALIDGYYSSMQPSGDHEQPTPCIEIDTRGEKCIGTKGHTVGPHAAFDGQWHFFPNAIVVEIDHEQPTPEKVLVEATWPFPRRADHEQPTPHPFQDPGPASPHGFCKVCSLAEDDDRAHHEQPTPEPCGAQSPYISGYGSVTCVHPKGHRDDHQPAKEHRPELYSWSDEE